MRLRRRYSKSQPSKLSMPSSAPQQATAPPCPQTPCSTSCALSALPRRTYRVQSGSSSTTPTWGSYPCRGWSGRGSGCTCRIPPGGISSKRQRWTWLRRGWGLLGLRMNFLQSFISCKGVREGRGGAPTLVFLDILTRTAFRLGFQLCIRPRRFLCPYLLDNLALFFCFL